MNRSTNTSSLHNQLSSLPRWQVILESTSLSLIDFLALAGNLLVWVAVAKNCRLRRISTNLFILSLSASDILMALTCIPLSLVALIKGRWALGNFVCQIQGFIFFVLAFVSLLTVALVAINRYMSVAKPRFYRVIFSNKNSMIMIVSIWLFCLSYVTIFMCLNGNIFYFDPKKLVCHIELLDETFRDTWNIMTGLIFALLPMATVFFCYFKLFRTIRTHNLVTIRSMRRQSPLNTSAEEIRVTKLIVAIMVGFSCCWLPSFGIAYLQLIVPHLFKTDRVPHIVYTFLVYSSSMINPFIYGILNSTFRSEFLKILLCKKSHNLGDTEAMEMRKY